MMKMLSVSVLLLRAPYSGAKIHRVNMSGTVTLHYNDFFTGKDSSQMESQYGLVILNSERPPEKNSTQIKLMKHIWPAMHIRCCADGGANRLFDELLDTDHDKYIPEFIAGDLDSLRSEVKEFYSKRGTSVSLIEDQNNNDLDKCMNILHDKLITSSSNPLQPKVVLILGAFGGRFDQEMASIHSLFKWTCAFDRVVLLNGETVATLLKKGSHTLRLIPKVEGPVCGLIPIAGPVQSVESSGLMWNIEGRRLEFGVLTSSSNQIAPESNGIVDIRTTDDVLWTCSLAKSI